MGSLMHNNVLTWMMFRQYSYGTRGDRVHFQERWDYLREDSILNDIYLIFVVINLGRR